MRVYSFACLSSKLHEQACLVVSVRRWRILVVITWEYKTPVTMYSTHKDIFQCPLWDKTKDTCQYIQSKKHYGLSLFGPMYICLQYFPGVFHM